MWIDVRSGEWDARCSDRQWAISLWGNTGAERVVWDASACINEGRIVDENPSELIPEWSWMDPSLFMVVMDEAGYTEQDIVLWSVTDDARGWPMLALHGGADLYPIQPDVMTPYFRAIVIGGRGSNSGIVLLPLSPILPGFAINTVFYATILWLLTLGPFTARRIIRRKRGLCIKCGYDLCGTEHNACPECGLKI